MGGSLLNLWRVSVELMLGGEENRGRPARPIYPCLYIVVEQVEAFRCVCSQVVVHIATAGNLPRCYLCGHLLLYIYVAASAIAIYLYISF